MERKAFEVGDEVVVKGCYSDPPQINRIAKVYKNGNFVLEGAANQQYRPNGHPTTGYNPRFVVRATAEVRAEVARAALEHRVRAALQGFRADQYTTERLEKLVELLTPDA